MSLQFSNTTTKSGILQRIERLCKLNDGGITGNALKLAEFTSDVNLAMDRALSIIFKACATWQFDDSNHTDYPIITTSLVSGQRDYTFTTDETGNLILDIYKVVVKNPDGTYQEVYPVDQQSDVYTDNSTNGFWNGLNTSGTPKYYDKTANGIFLDVIPNYNSTNGLKIYINRESTYFLTTDTTKKPGFAGLFHEYLAFRPSYQYALINSLPNVNQLQALTIDMESQIQQHYTSRERDIKKSMKPLRENNR